MARNPMCVPWLILIGAILCAGPELARAEDTSQVPARELFQRGVTAVAEGDLAGALTHFQAAYDQSPNQTVLFNIAQTQIALARPARAARTLRRYVELDRSPPRDARSRRVRELLAYTERQLGKVAVEITPADALLEVDGIAETPDADGTIETAIGARQLVVTRDGYQTSVHRVEVMPGRTARAKVDLIPIPAQPSPEPELAPAPKKGELHVRTSRPGALVLVDGSPLLAPTVDPGTYVIEVTKPGYQPWRKNVGVAAGQTAVVTALLSPAPPSREAETAANRRFWTIGSGVAGLALVGGGIAVLVTNHVRYGEYRRDHDDFSRELASGESAPDHPARAASLEARAARIQRTDDIGIGMTLLGGLCVAVSGALFTWDLDPSEP